jgi:hypothetical protein
LKYVCKCIKVLLRGSVRSILLKLFITYRRCTARYSDFVQQHDEQLLHFTHRFSRELTMRFLLFVLSTLVLAMIASRKKIRCLKV